MKRPFLTPQVTAASVLGAIGAVTCGFIIADHVQGPAQTSELSDRPTVQAIPSEPELADLPHDQRFAEIGRDLAEGFAGYDVAGSVAAGTRPATIATAMFGYERRYEFHALEPNAPQPMFCLVDVARKVWFYSIEDPQNARGVYLLGDGTECSEDPADAVGYAVLANGDLEHKKAIASTRAAIEVFLRPPTTRN